MTTVDPEDSKLSRLIKDHESSYIEDAGFTSRVMEALPPSRSVTRMARRRHLLMVSSLLSIPVTALLGGHDLFASFSNLMVVAATTPVIECAGLGFGILPLACLTMGFLFAAFITCGILKQTFR